MSVEAIISRAEERLRIPEGLLWACAYVESGLDSEAKRYERHLDDWSLGLLQILTGTARDRSWLDPMGLEPVESSEALLDPETNVLYGGSFLRYQYTRFPEIVGGKDWPVERWKFAVAAYNGGRGHINAALAAARKSLGVEINDRGEYPWREWWFTQGFLGVYTGQSAESAQSNRHHVSKVWAAWWRYKREHSQVSA